MISGNLELFKVDQGAEKREEIQSNRHAHGRRNRGGDPGWGEADNCRPEVQGSADVFPGDRCHGQRREGLRPGSFCRSGYADCRYSCL